MIIGCINNSIESTNSNSSGNSSSNKSSSYSLKTSIPRNYIIKQALNKYTNHQDGFNGSKSYKACIIVVMSFSIQDYHSHSLFDTFCLCDIATDCVKCLRKRTGMKHTCILLPIIKTNFIKVYLSKFR